MNELSEPEEGTILGEDQLEWLGEDVSSVILAIAKTAQVISKQLSFRVGLTERMNPFGEKQAELDVYANDLFSKSLLSTGVVGQVASEELGKPLLSVETRKERGSSSSSSPSPSSAVSYSSSPPHLLSVAMDPLDGSSNITTNNPLGSIFGIWRGDLPQRGKNQVASAFVTYGPTLSITFTDGSRVDQYVEAREGPNSGRFLLAYKCLKLPERPEVYGFGANRTEWIPPVSRFVQLLEERQMKLRYGGTFIGDYNQILKRGGVFSYPATRDRPMGKLRILYETAPISLITEAAGGRSSDGSNSILEIEPSSLKDTSPFYTGNKELILELEEMIRKG